MSPAPLRLAALLVVAAAAPGCFWATTKHEGELMNEQLKTLDVRVAKQEQSMDQRAKLLDESIDKATKLLTRNSADLGTQVDKFSEELARLTGRVADLQRTADGLRSDLTVAAQQKVDADARLAALTTRLEVLEKQLGIKAGATPTSQPVVFDKGALFDQAYQRLQAGQYAEARRLFRLFLLQAPEDERADNAQYWVGEAFYKEKDYERAIAEFQKVIDTYPKGDVADAAYLAAGSAALDELECRVAAAYLGELVKRFDKSPLVKSAKQKLDLIKKSAKNPKVCKPG